MALFLFATFYAAMAAAGYIIEIVFGALGLIPTERNAQVSEGRISWNCTAWPNIVFLLLAAVLVVRFVRTGGVPKLRMMGGNPDDAGEHDHDHSTREHSAHGHSDHDLDASGGQRRTNTAPERTEVPPGRARRPWPGPTTDPRVEAGANRESRRPAMMPWYEDGMMSSAGGLFGGMLTLIVWGLAVVGVIALVRGWRSGGFNLDRRRPEQILDERFARGEIDIEEYTRRRQLLRPGH